MRYFVWFARLLVFVLVLMFALNNTEPVAVRFYGGHFVADVPLIIVMLVTFVLGTVFALLLTALTMLRRSREVKRLKRALSRLQNTAQPSLRHAVKESVRSPQTVVPPAPL